jgi:hypothetical protein
MNPSLFKPNQVLLETQTLAQAYRSRSARISGNYPPSASWLGRVRQIYESQCEILETKKALDGGSR